MKNPSISCVIIGINVERTLKKCIESIKNSDYPEKLEIIYVDGGSTDNSLDMAKSLSVKIFNTKTKNITPGLQRNIGWKHASNELVHFFDSDTIVDKNWLKKAVKEINTKTVAVCGYRKEIQPNKNWFHFISNIEWDSNLEIINKFGGDVLIKKSILKETTGYNPNLIAGEDPELSFRIVKKGYKIKRIDANMCFHDINMTSFNQYFKRCFRTGYSYAEVGLMRLKEKEFRWFFITAKTMIKITGTITLLFMSIIFKNINFLFLIFILNMMPVVKIPLFKKKFKLTNKESTIYSFHLIIANYIKYLGMLRYFIGKTFNYPLTNRRLIKK